MTSNTPFIQRVRRFFHSDRRPTMLFVITSVMVAVFVIIGLTACSAPAGSPRTSQSGALQTVSLNNSASSILQAAPQKPADHVISSQLSSQPSIVSTPTQIAGDIRAQADAMEQVLVNVFQRADPSVVNIEVNIDNNDDIDASGSGFVVDMDGHIVTNNHVINDAREITVTFYDGYTTSAKLIGQDTYSDLAILKVDVTADRLNPLSFGDSSQLKVGQRVIAIGNPFGLLSSMTTGIVSATGRTLNSARMSYRNPSIIQTDAQINPGNSGGPLLNMNGEVIGVNTAISTDTGTFQGVGFAVPSNTVKRVIPQLIKKGKADYAWLGIHAVGGREGLSVAALAERLKLPVDAGVMISEVIDNSPAQSAGLRGGDHTEAIRGQNVQLGGDIIVAINDTPVRDLDALLAYLVANADPGDTVTVTFLRGNETMKVDVKLQARPGGDQ